MSTPAPTYAELEIGLHRTEGETYQFPTEQGLNGGVLCIASDEAQAALDGSFVALASFDEALYDELGAISAAAYGG